MSQTFLGIPIKTARWRIAVLRILYPRRNVVQLRGKTYLLRLPSQR